MSMNMQVVKSIQENGGKAVAIKADVSKVDEVKTLFEESLAAFPDDKIEVTVRAKCSGLRKQHGFVVELSRGPM